MFNILLVALGGAVGAVCRYLTGGAALRMMGPDWPYGTFFINVTGSLLMGVLAGWLAFRGEGGMEWRLFFGTGVLGGFTTFSAFSLDVFNLMQRGESGLALVYVVASVLLSIAAVFAGFAVIRGLT